ncbi:hypothetical protein SAMN05421827_10440 [Pedobacter terrae]|uniref:Uncharacterized protein n=1 Tax=Pedobacter terrae TaxID=405671 RepID=A0A1G7S518_9SPHI|nr:hypothetical protein SAMN05421827_10440 [Pedobacter terrae]
MACIAIYVSSRFPFYPDEKSGCSLHPIAIGSGLCGPLGGAIFGWVLIAQIFVPKPGRSGSPRLQFGAIADNGAAAPETLLNVHFQISNR